MAIVLSSSNLVGYVKCKKDAGKDVKSMASNFLGRQILTQVNNYNNIITMKAFKLLMVINYVTYSFLEVKTYNSNW